jgi:hypothetical protein
MNMMRTALVKPARLLGPFFLNIAKLWAVPFYCKEGQEASSMSTQISDPDRCRRSPTGTQHLQVCARSPDHVPVLAAMKGTETAESVEVNG